MTTKAGEIGPKSRKVWIPVVLMVVGLAGFFAFRIMWGLMKLGYVDSAIGRMRVLHTAESQFAKVHPELGYAFEIFGCQVPTHDRPNSMYYITARPLHLGQPAFCSDQSGVLRADYNGSIENCRTNGVPL